MIGIPKSSLRCLLLRGALSLLLTSGLLPWFGATALPARADGPECRDPDARVQLLIKHFIVYNDGDWHSSGEIKMRFNVGQHGLENCSELEGHLVTSLISFSADDGDVVALDRPIPRDGDSMGVGVTETFGLPLYAGARYVVGFDLSESDTLCCQYDRPESPFPEMNADNGWLIGRHDYRTPLDSTPAGTVGYEIRYMPLPDLHPTDIKVLAIPGSTDDLVCMGVENIGPVEAGPFQAALHLNGQLATNGVAQAGRLGAGQHGDLCVQTRLPTAGRFRLSAVVDEPRGIFEINERNNDLDQQFIGKQTANIVGENDLIIGPAGANPNAAAPADLMVEAIRVQGKEPSGQNDCDPGKNDIIAVVKNRGAGAGSAIVVRLVVDGEEDEAQEETITSLDAAKTAEVVFDDVRLKGGQRKLTITLDPKNSISESDEGNNVRDVMLSCKNED